MAVPTLAELIDALTPDEIYAAILAKLQANDFPTTDWSSGAPERTLVEAEADSQEELWALVASIAAGGEIDLATGAWLTRLAYNRYNLTRDVAVATVGTITLTCAASAGPYTITNNTLEFQGAGGNLYTNTAGAGVLASGGTIDLTITARSPGADEGNDGADTIVTMTTPLAGVTCTNPAETFSDVELTGTGTGTVTPSFTTASSASWVILITLSGQTGVAEFRLSNDGGLTYGAAQATGGALVDVDSTGLDLAFANGAVNPSFVAGEYYEFTSQGTWTTTAGSDEESDETLRARCKAQWALLSSTPTDDAYTRMCLDADSSVEKVRVSVDGAVAARVNIVIAGSSGTVDATVVAAVQDYVDARQAFTDDPVVAPAGTMAITLAGATVRVKTQYLANAQTRAQANLATYFGTCGIGDGSTVFVRFSQVIEAILRESGNEDDSVVGLTLNTATNDLVITANAVATWAQRIATAVTWTTY
jgi:uncharacterized phage protein gp47/JayE